jgi:hypothetical protein
MAAHTSIGPLKLDRVSQIPNGAMKAASVFSDTSARPLGKLNQMHHLPAFKQNAANLYHLAGSPCQLL